MKQMDQIIENLKCTDKSPEYYQYYPRLFRAYFPQVTDNCVNDLCDAGYLYYQSVLMLDSLFDDKNFSNVPVIFSFQEETVKTLTSIYGKDSEFWKYWDKRKEEYFDAVKIEKQLNHRNVTWEVYENLADKKSAFGKIAIDCLFTLSDRKYQMYETLLRSHAFFSVGFQLYDDVKDFKEDIARNQFNWTVYQLSEQVDFEENDVLTLNKLLYIRGVAQKTLQESISYFDKAREVLRPYKIESEWLNTIRKMKDTISGYLDSTEGYLKSILKKIELQKQINSEEFICYNISDTHVKKGLDYIKKDYDCQYAELQHVMYLSKFADDFDNNDEVHCSDTFQRAMINDCLMDICKYYNVNCSDLIDKETEYLISRRNHDSTGGWSYFPTVKEIAADIDDLGQIMQLFIKSGRIELVDEYCRPAIQVALDSKYNKSGGIATWIIPNDNRTMLQEKQVLFNETKWGAGPDVEVVANFAYALSLYDREKYDSRIQDAIKFIINLQNEYGYWLSRWYYGNHYGTYVCLRLLRQYQNDATATCMELATDFLICTQNEDGGYSMNESEKSDVLSTALATLSLKLFYDKKNPNIQKAEKYLIDNQQKGGSWEMVDFIKPKVNEPYKSQVLTTAFVLRALL